ncbi:hypothetical protein I3517_29065 [Rhodococcus erythropolis]|uniref:Uncharacterized protein n=1 Tax=Rhodococcus erythropolis TaxID=1833 RepID=A0A8I1A0F4_RHOER|nr:hypothetical protein [Rhodococcus erythropolis]
MSTVLEGLSPVQYRTQTLVV